MSIDDVTTDAAVRMNSALYQAILSSRIMTNNIPQNKPKIFSKLKRIWNIFHLTSQLFDFKLMEHFFDT